MTGLFVDGYGDAQILPLGGIAPETFPWRKDGVEHEFTRRMVSDQWVLYSLSAYPWIPRIRSLKGPDSAHYRITAFDDLLDQYRDYCIQQTPPKRFSNPD